MGPLAGIRITPVARGVLNTPVEFDFLLRGRRSVAMDLNHPQGAAAVLRLIEQADAVLEGFRPGVCERLGIGPDSCMARNSRLVYGRMTGWGRSGPAGIGGRRRGDIRDGRS